MSNYGWGPRRGPGAGSAAADLTSAASSGAVPGKRSLVESVSAPIQRRKEAGAPASPASPPRATGGGAPLPEATAQKMERAFQTSFADVRVRVGEAAPAVGARAYAQGNQLTFAPGHYEPGTEHGDALIAHELTHVVQQRAGRVSTPQAQPESSDAAPINADPGLEAEADAAGDRVARGEPAGIAAGGSGAASSDGPIQRAVGFEFEFGEWRSERAAGGRLAKGEAIERVDGAFQVQGEDVASAVDQSAVEFVTEPAATPDDVARIVGGAAAKAEEYFARPDPGRVGDVNITHGAQRRAQMQVSPAVALGAIPRLYASAQPGTAAKFLGKQVGDTVSTAEFQATHLGGAPMSPELQGLLTLVVDYLRQGTTTARLNYPKEAITMMARTSFTKMFSMLPERDRLAAHREQWVAMVLEVLASCSVAVAPLTNDPDRPAMGQTFMDLDPVPRPGAPAPARSEQLGASAELPGGGDPEHLKLNVTRGEWLNEMPERDLLSNATDQRFEGMGKLGNATDLAEAAGAALAALALDGAHDDAAHDDAADAGPEAPAPEADADGAPPRGEAPLFELRGGTEMFGVAKQAPPEQWLPEATEIFRKVHEANEHQVYRSEPAPLDRPAGRKVTNPHLWETAPQPVVAPRPARRPAPERARSMAEILLGLFCCR